MQPLDPTNILDKIRDSESVYDEDLDVEVFFFLTNEHICSIDYVESPEYGDPTPIYSTKTNKYNYVEDIMGCVENLRFILSFVEDINYFKVYKEGTYWITDIETKGFSAQGKHMDPQLSIVVVVCAIILEQRARERPPPVNDNSKRQCPHLKPK